MTDKNKKIVIAILLLLACLVSGFLLVYSSSNTVRPISSHAKADSLLKNDFDLFNIPAGQMREVSIRIDSVNRRKEYHIHVAPGFSKTQLHHEIKQTFYPYNIQTPGRVIFPQKDHVIHLSDEGTVFSSIYLRTDPELTLQRNLASLMVAFESPPSRDLLRQIDQFGDPIPLVFIIERPEEAEEIVSLMRGRADDIYFWLRPENRGSESTAEEDDFPSLQLLEEYAPKTGVLHFSNPDGSLQPRSSRLPDGTSLSYVDASDAVLLRAEMGEDAFTQELRKFSREAQRGRHPTAILMADSEALQWLQQELPRYKKSGLRIVEPEKKTFQ